MNPISHKQAIQWIDRRLDGLLAQRRLLLLDEHLRSCDTCRAYAAEMDQLPAQLQNELHARWDEKPGPSPKIMQQVTAKARYIPVTKRISSGIKLLAGTATLLLLGVALNFVVSQWRGTSLAATGTETVNALPRAEDRLLAFPFAQNGNYDIAVMHADGSGLTNLTNHPASDTNPFWSPDGRRMAFESDRDGFTHIFLMDADGSNVVQLTNGEAQHYFSNTNPWSPDGSKLLFAEWTPQEEKWMLSVIGVDGLNKTPFMEVPNIYSNPSWSPDGRHVVFLADDPQNLGGNRLYVVDADGQNRRELTQSLQVNEQLSTMEYDWSLEGQSIFFVGFVQTTDPSWTVYEARVADSSLITHATTKTPLFDWWNDISVISPFIWKRSDETLSTLNPYENCQQTDAAQSGSYMKRSRSGMWLISAYCPNGDIWFYWVRSNGTLNRQLLDVPIPSEQGTLSDLMWSPDEKFVAFNVFSKNLTEMYILDIEASLNDPSVKPLKITVSGGTLFSSISWQPIP